MICKCGQPATVQKTGECRRCYDRRRYHESEARTQTWRAKHGFDKYKYMSKAKLRAEIDKMHALLKEQAELWCDTCGEKQCADCWAIDYHETGL